MKKVTIFLLVVTFLYFVLSTAQAMAASDSDFPACSNPQWHVTVSWPSGVHGIAGDSLTHTGSDKVYQSSDDSMNIQCFCPSDSTSGIQTNWFKVGNLSQDEISAYEHQGWVYIPTGKVWGLSDDPYLAKNLDYTCSGSNSGGGSGGSSNNSSGGSSNGSSTGVVEAVGAVLGLANTGSTITLLSIASIGLVAFFLSFLLRRSK